MRAPYEYRKSQSTKEIGRRQGGLEVGCPPADRELEERIRQLEHDKRRLLRRCRELAERCATDALTKLLSRYAFEESFARLFSQARRFGRQLTLVFLDIDSFKRINDRLGHAVGDSVLAALGEAVRSCTRRADFAGRYGGDEILIALSDTGPDGAQIFADKLYQQVGCISIEMLGRSYSVSVSIGMASYPAAYFEDAAAMIAAADSSMYCEKSKYRARVGSDEIISDQRGSSHE